jgi:hypothetical protein
VLNEERILTLGTTARIIDRDITNTQVYPGRSFFNQASSVFGFILGRDEPCPLSRALYNDCFFLNDG